MMRFKNLIIGLLAMFFVKTIIVAQDLKKNLTEDDFNRWYHFYEYTLSSDGKWLHYNVYNPVGIDTMILQKTNNTTKQILWGGTQGRFSPHSDGFAFLREGQLYYQKLTIGKWDSIQGVNTFSFSKNGDFIIAEGINKDLKLLHWATKKIHHIADVEAYVVSPDSNCIALIQQKGKHKAVGIIPLAFQNKMFELATFTSNISHLTWNNKGNGIAFFEAKNQNKQENTHHLLHYLTFKDSKLNQHSTSIDLPENYELPTSRLFFSVEDEHLFFDIKPNHKTEKTDENVIIWSSTAKVLPPKVGDRHRQQWLMCWHIKTNYFILVNNEEFPVAIPMNTGEYALVIDNKPYLPHFKHKGIFADLYIKSLKSGQSKLIAKKINHQKNHINLSPLGNFITWFDNKNWWLYTIDTASKHCLTCEIEAHFEDIEYDRPGTPFPNDKPHWTTGDHALILTDFYDLWIFTPKDKTSKRLTSGYKYQNKYRVYDNRFPTSLRDIFFNYQTASFDLNKGVIFKKVHHKTLAEGFAIYQSNAPLTPGSTAENKIDPILHAGETFLYVMSDFDKSPELIVHHSADTLGQVVQRSNEHQKEYYWGKSELIHYTVNGDSLKGVLLYPANYQPEKKYPMIVKIYEKKSSLLHQYTKPSMYNHIGFNETNYTHAGYFVLLPDIVFTINKPGESALHCVTAAVDKAIATATIDEANIGLFGHSFAGFEVSYIATQTQRFKTVISGAGWHDLISTYLGTDDAKTSNIWRFDTQQLRMTEPYFTKAFMANTPLLQADKIQTPILLWTGMNDLRVNAINSMNMQIALWRLGKESTLLLYPNETHVLTQAFNQRDLTVKTMEWFDYYLKGKNKPKWIE